jgi:transcriptional regulator with XRE-family HTH domain
VGTSEEREAWTLDQITKSGFFHQKLHDWGLLEVAARIETIHGEEFDWKSEDLGITETAWNRVVHRGIKPVIVFAHPEVLERIPGSVGYYRMLAMVSQKSMARVNLRISRYESGSANPNHETALAIAKHLNKITSSLVELDQTSDAREFDLWRGMAAGSQAQGAWQNRKGIAAEEIVKGIVQRRLRDRNLISEESAGGRRIRLRDGRTVEFADEPDVTILRDSEPIAALEIKGGIDAAGVLERIGAALKTLRGIRQANPEAATVLILQRVSLTGQARRHLDANRETVTRWFTLEHILEDEEVRDELFRRLGI